MAAAVRERALGKRKLALVTDIPEAVRNDLDLLCRQVGWFCQFCTSVGLFYRVSLVVLQVGLVDLDFGCSSCWRAFIVATYC